MTSKDHTTSEPAPATLDLTFPESWHTLTQPNLAFLLKTMAEVQLMNSSTPQLLNSSTPKLLNSKYIHIFIRCLFRWNNITIVTPYGENWIVAHNGTEYLISPATLAAAALRFQWITTIPDVPVRLESIDGAKAVPADIEDELSFDEYLAVEACWQIWIEQPDDNLLRQMAAILYRKPDIKLRKFEYLSIFYWWTGLKNLLSTRYPDFYKPAPVDTAFRIVDELSLRRNIDAQIRALSKGDITKETEILSLPAIRAITELNALAAEYNELNRKYPKK